MLYVSWIGRERSEREPTAADQERFAAAIMKPLPKRDLQRDPRRAPKGSTEGTTVSGTTGNSATRRAS